MTGRTPARLLAPTALVATALALLLILSGGGAEPTSDNGTASPAQNTTTESGSDQEASGSGDGEDSGSEGGGRRRYTVKPGDTPSGIAEKVGIPLEELLDLNPEVDPQTLSPGQKLRLR